MVLVDKPEELRHGGAPIYSISCSPCGRRLATVGGDQRVKVWGVGEVVRGLKRAAARRKQRAGGGVESVRPAGKAPAEGPREAAPAPKLLATLASHAAPVNCAAFSLNGRWLATGADDHLVQVHELRPGEAPHASDFGSGDQHSLEHWAKWLTFSGHQNNVTDLAWSPDDSMVASCSLDNTVRVHGGQRGTVGGPGQAGGKCVVEGLAEGLPHSRHALPPINSPDNHALVIGL